MGTFNTKEILTCSPSLIPSITEALVAHFRDKGFEVTTESLGNGGCDVSIHKGNIFKSILGMKTALKITLNPQGSTIIFDAGVGIFGKQLIPTFIMWYVAWPVLLTQIWGLVQQSKLDDEALEIARSVIATSSRPEVPMQIQPKLCTECGLTNDDNAIYCCRCGKKL